MRSDEPLKISQGEIEQIFDDRKNQKVNHEGEEPLSSDAFGPIANPCREAGEQEQTQDGQLPYQADPPQRNTAVVVLQCLGRWLGNLDGADARVKRRSF